MDLREILDQTFVTMRNNFWTFQGIMFKSFLPSWGIFLLGVISVVIFLFAKQASLNIPFTSELYWTELFRSSLLSSALMIIFLLLLGIAFFITTLIGGIYFTYSSIKIYQSGLHGKKCTLKEAFAGIKGYRLRLFLNWLLLALAATIFSVPVMIISSIIQLNFSPLIGQIVSFVLNNSISLFFSFFFFLMPAIIVISNYDLGKALKRSFVLPRQHRLRILGILFVLFLLETSLIIALVFPPSLMIMLAVTLKNIYGYILAFSLLILSILFFNVLCSFTYGPMVALYYDLQIRKEGYDLQLQLSDANQESSGIN